MGNSQFMIVGLGGSAPASLTSRGAGPCDSFHGVFRAFEAIH